MLHPRLEMEPITGSQNVYGEWRSLRLAPEKQAGAFADFQVLIFLLMFLKRQITSLLYNQKFFDPRMLMQRNHYAAPQGFDHVPSAGVNLLSQFRKPGDGAEVCGELLPPNPARLTAITV